MRVELIVFFLALAIFLFVQIARNLRAKNNQTETQDKPRIQEVKKEKKRKLSVGWIVAIAVLALIIYSGYNYYAKTDSSPQPSARVAEMIPLCADQKIYILTFDQPDAKVPLQPTCWSGWVRLPNQAKFSIANPGQLQLLTWDGHYLEFGADATEWLGEISFANFRLKGNGDATVSVEKKS